MALAQRGQAAVAGDREQPRPQRHGALVGEQRPVGRGERDLHRILGIVPRGEHVQAERQEARGVTVVEDLERRGVAAAHRLDEPLVAGQPQPHTRALLERLIALGQFCSRRPRRAPGPASLPLQARSSTSNQRANCCSHYMPFLCLATPISRSARVQRPLRADVQRRAAHARPQRAGPCALDRAYRCFSAGLPSPAPSVFTARKQHSSEVSMKALLKRKLLVVAVAAALLGGGAVAVAATRSSAPRAARPISRTSPGDSASRRRAQERDAGCRHRQDRSGRGATAS